MPSEADPQVLSQMVQAAQAKRWPILLAGRSGVGKSCLACLVASHVPHWRFAAASELIGWVLQARMSDTKSVLVRTMAGAEVERNETEIFRWVEWAQVLVLDDVGVRLLTEVQSDILLRVLDLRFGKPTIVTTNCTAETLPQMVGERCASRLRAGAQFRMVGNDRRIATGGPR
jgi:DNA replication protein DnaC